MDFIDITNLTDDELRELLKNATVEARKREEERRTNAEKAFFDAARALYKIDPYYDFPICACDLESEDCLTLERLLSETGQKKIKKALTNNKIYVII